MLYLWNLLGMTLWNSISELHLPCVLAYKCTDVRNLMIGTLFKHVLWWMNESLVLSFNVCIGPKCAGPCFVHIWCFWPLCKLALFSQRDYFESCPRVTTHITELRWIYSTINDVLEFLQSCAHMTWPNIKLGLSRINLFCHHLLSVMTCFVFQYREPSQPYF